MKNNIRAAVFWGLDYLKGRPVHRQFMDIQKQFQVGEPSQKALKELLQHAVSKVPYYEAFQEQMDLKKFPVVTKMDFKENLQSFLAAGFDVEKLHTMSTSGSTGTPFTVYMNGQKRSRVIAEILYYNHQEGLYLGERYMYLKTWRKRKPPIESFMQNVVPVDVLRLDEEKLRQVVAILKKDQNISYLLAYASVYDALAKYLRENGVSGDFSPRRILSSSTLLREETKEILENTFGCPVLDRYSNQENGLLGQTRENGCSYYVNFPSYYMELLSLTSDAPAKLGEVGRVVVTDLYNYAMPMIRYDTGDLALASRVSSGGAVLELQKIMGRQLDAIYDTKERMLTAHTWSVHMRKYHKVRQWQFIQHGKKNYELILNDPERHYTQEDYTDTVLGILGKDAELTLTYVEEIPVTASGKFKNTVCYYQPKAL